MDSYTLLLERLRVPQPSLQKLAVISIFENLRSAPPYLSPDSDPGRLAITQCLNSNSAPIIDQSVRELCRLVKNGFLQPSRALLELQSALEGSNPNLNHVFVKGIGFIVRFDFNNNGYPLVYDDSLCLGVDAFVKVVSSRIEARSEVVQQVLLVVQEGRKLGFSGVCEFLRRFLNYAVLGSEFEFTRGLVSSIASLACSFEYEEAIVILKLLNGCLKYCKHDNAEEFKNFLELAGYLVDAYIVVLRKAVEIGLPIGEVQLCGVEVLETLLSLCTNLDKQFVQKESILELSKNILAVQKELHLQYIPELSSVTTSLFIILTLAEFEHEQLSILKLSIFLLKWKRENEHAVGKNGDLSEDLLFVFPVVSLLSSSSRSIMAAGANLLALLEELLIDLLVAQNKVPAAQGDFSSGTKSESIIHRLLQHLWSQEHHSPSSSYFFRFISIGKTGIKKMSWVCQLREYCLIVVERQKSRLLTQSPEIPLREMPLLLSSIVAVLVMHPTARKDAMDSLAVIGIMDPKVSLSLLMSVLFYNKIFSKNGGGHSHEIVLKLLEILPSLASHSSMTPLILQTILPMLQRDAKLVLRATANRLLCKTWEVTDRVFGSLQAILHPNAFKEFVHVEHICLSMAASIRDVCRKNPDRGVDLILSVSACIESQSPIVQALGFQSLGHLCEADVIDFYTAWNVIAKHALDYYLDPIVAHGVCCLLRWGAMDAEAYSEASKNLMQILWKVGTSRHPYHGSVWVKARCSAFVSLTEYEVVHIQNGIPDFKKKNAEFLISEENPEVLSALEGFEDKIITFEHITRRRLIKEKRVANNKVEKFLDVFTQVIFPSGKSISNVRDLPGAALVCLSFTPKVLDGKGTIKDLPKLHAAYENALVEIAESLHLSRNLLIAQLSLQSWITFMQRWMKAVITLLGSKVPSNASDKTTKAADDILKKLINTAEKSIPRSAENIALAICALCMVLPPSAHEVTASASKFLLKWLFEFEHEHRQWSSAVALGYVSSCLHATDHRHKFQIISGLLKVSNVSKNTLVIGACGFGLGIASQHILIRVEVAEGSSFEETSRGQDTDLLAKIVVALSTKICQLSPSSFGSLQSLCNYFLPYTKDASLAANLDQPCNDDNELEEDVWAVAGLVLALGNVACAIYQAGHSDAVLTIKDLLRSWIPHINPVVPMSALSVGSCLALPMVVAFCQRIEIIGEDELNYLVNGYKNLISELLCIKKSGIFHQSLLMASCIGAGNLLSCILDEGVYSLKADNVKSLLELFRKSYSNSYPPSVHFGGMLGVVNALGAGAGAGAGTFSQIQPKPDFLQTGSGQKESSYVRGPILATTLCEPLSTLLIQEMFLVAQDSKNIQLQNLASWAIAFLKHCWWYNNKPQSNSTDAKSASQTFPEDSAVWQLCLWLMDLNCAEGLKVTHINTVATVLRCLSRAPRLPSLDWGVIIRRCMRYEEQVSGRLPAVQYLGKQSLREECIKFALAHANHVNSLLLFLDELCDLSRFKTLELNLKTCLLCHLLDLIKVFSGSRIEKLFDDISDYFRSTSEVYNMEEKNLLRVSFWSGLYHFLDHASSDSPGFIANLERCMESLFALLPSLFIDGDLRMNQENSEWSEVVKCLGKARRAWVMDLLEVSDICVVEGRHLIEIMKRIQARTRLVMTGCIQMTELLKLKAHVLNLNSDGIWDVLVEVVWALQSAEGSIKRQWLVDAVEISCITKYPSTALQFLGLLSGSCCKYMPLLLVDRVAVLNDLAVTLPSLLSDTNWMVVAENVTLNLWKSTERIYEWARCLPSDNVGLGSQSIDDSERSMAALLMRVTHRTCVSLRDYLPLEKQLRLANMVVP